MTSAPPSAVDAAAAALVADMTTEERAASVVMGHIPQDRASALKDYMSTGLGGFLLMGANVPADESDLRALTEALTIDPAVPPLIAIDQEGGLVSRLGSDDFPASTVLKDRPADAAAAAFSARGALVAQRGANVNFGIVADVTSDRDSFIFGRALGTDPSEAADRVAAAVSAEEPFVASTLKHFPGHGAAPGDSHDSIPSTDMLLARWQETHARPFAAGIDAGASLLMFGHLAYTAVDDEPASLSARWHEIARDDLGFDGVMITDDLGMLQSSGISAYEDPVRNAVLAIAAGNDMVLAVALSTPRTAEQMVDGIADAVASGEIPPERLQDAAERVMALRLQIAASGLGWEPCETCAPVP